MLSTQTFPGICITLPADIMVEGEVGKMTILE